MLTPGFSFISFACAIDVLRVANMLSGQTLYSYRVLSTVEGQVHASNGTPAVPEAHFEKGGDCQLIVVFASYGAEQTEDEALFAWLRRASRRGTCIAAAGTAPYILARAGLLEGRLAALHWESINSFMEEFPGLGVCDRVFVEDKNVWTCCGGTSAFDMMVALVARDHGAELSRAVADQLVYPSVRKSGDTQQRSAERLRLVDPELAALIKLMEGTLEDPLTLEQLARRAHLSPRKMQRLFATRIGRTPKQFYVELRLARARSLLSQTRMPVAEIAVSCGFSSASHFSNLYKRVYQISPLAERARAQASAGGSYNLASSMPPKQAYRFTPAADGPTGDHAGS
ncbi:GlxA family transcriptional regulator [Ancylobacter sp. A5.8]|uniref:GlxA family transcriptional regulator n=1 Tax=Ancylobacter gelatini TaxID=2919920 RepID=UPI001F4DACBF|nr:GlxA family transcriptional regulator [Ancylobacter gelatini]